MVYQAAKRVAQMVTKTVPRFGNVDITMVTVDVGVGADDDS